MDNPVAHWGVLNSNERKTFLTSPLPSQRLLILWNPPFTPATSLCPLDPLNNTALIVLNLHLYIEIHTVCQG